MKILLAVDGSPHSQEAADEVGRRPWPKSSIVRVLSAVHQVMPAEVDFAAGVVNWDQIGQAQTRKAERLTATVADTLRATDLRVETAVRHGDPRSAIVAEAQEWSADLIVVGSHGHTRLERLLMGSVADSVVNHAPCSVEIVRRREST